MFRLRRKTKLSQPITLSEGDRLEVLYTGPLLDGTFVVDEPLLKDFAEPGTYDTALIIDFENEFGLKKGYMGGVAKEDE